MKNPTLALGAPALVSLSPLFLLPGQGQAEEVADAFLGAVPLYVSVTRMPQELSETPASVMVIDREMIEAAGAVEVADLLRLVPGFVVAHYYDPLDGSRTVVSYYGASDQYARRLQVLVDGMSVYMPATGSVEWPDLPVAIEDIERIEVVRGPNGAAYGSNSFLGVINIITRQAGDVESKGWVTAGSSGYREAGVRLAGGENNFHYRVTGGYRASPGYRNVGFTSSSNDEAEINDAGLTRSLNLRGDYRASVNDYLTFQAAFANGPRNLGSESDPFAPAREQRMETDYQQAGWRRMLDSDAELQVLVSHSRHEVRDRFAIAPFLAPADLGLEAERWSLEASHRFRLSPAWRMVWGGEYRSDDVSGGTYFDHEDGFNNTGHRLFFNAEWQPAPAWTVNLGDLYEANDLIDDHSPRLSISRRVAGDQFVRATASRAYRVPAMVEEYIDFTLRDTAGNLLQTLYSSPGELKPERIDSLELALGGARGELWSYELKAFRNDITSLIAIAEDWTPRGSWEVREESGELTIFGTELQATLHPQPDLLVAFGMAKAHATGWRLKYFDPEQRQDIADSVPETTFSLLVSKRLAGGDQVGASLYAVSPVRHFSGDITEGVRTADIHYSHPFAVGGHTARIRALLRDVMGSYFDYEVETAREYQAFLTLEIAP